MKLKTPVRDAVYGRMHDLVGHGIVLDEMEIYMSRDCYMHFCDESTALGAEIGFYPDAGFKCSVKYMWDGISFVIRPKKYL